MADNLTTTTTVSTVPSGTIIATDEVGGAHIQRVKPTLGADGTAVDVSAGAGAVGTGTQRVTLASDDPAVASLAVLDDWDDGDRAKVTPPKVVRVSTAFNRPADTTAYAANDAIADNTTAGSVTKLQWSFSTFNSGIIRRVRIRKSDQSVATPTIRLWLWDATFTVGAGDNAAFAAPLQDAIGFVDVAVTSAGSDDAVGWTNCDIPFEAGTVFGLLQTLSAFTPANAEAFTIDLWHFPG